MGSNRLRGGLTSVIAKRRKSWLLAASALASSSLGISGPALAQCSAVSASGNATCTAGTYTDIVPVKLEHRVQFATIPASTGGVPGDAGVVDQVGSVAVAAG